MLLLTPLALAVLCGILAHLGIESRSRLRSNLLLAAALVVFFAAIYFVAVVVDNAR